MIVEEDVDRFKVGGYVGEEVGGDVDGDVVVIGLFYFLNVFVLVVDDVCGLIWCVFDFVIGGEGFGFGVFVVEDVGGVVVMVVDGVVVEVCEII